MYHKIFNVLYEPRHDKTNKMRERPVWSGSSPSAWRKLGSLATHWAHSQDSDHTGQMPRLIWVFAGHTVTLLVLSCPGSYVTYLSGLASFMHSISYYVSTGHSITGSDHIHMYLGTECLPNFICITCSTKNEPQHDKTNKMSVRPAKT